MDFIMKGEMIVTTTKNIQIILETAHTEIYVLTETPYSKHLFQVQEDGEYLSTQQQDLYRALVLNLLFVIYRSWPNINTAIAFLTTRTKQPNMDNHKNLACCVRYIRATVDMPLTIEAINSSLMRWWINAACGVHPDMKIHSIGMVSLGKGAMHSNLSKQTPNARISTEAEIVGVGDPISSFLWSIQLMNTQEYIIEENITF